MIRIALAVLAALALIWAVIIGIVGGVSFTVGGWHITSNDPWRPLLIGVALGALWMWISGPRRAIADTRAALTRVRPIHGALALAVVTFVVGLTGSSWTASGPDPFAYVSQAALWRAGHLEVPVPLAATAPWPNAPATFAPFGYRASADGTSIVPTTGPGLPLAMAAAQAIAGHAAAFLIVPVAGAVFVFATYLIGACVRSPSTGLLAAVLATTTPAFVYALMWPMSDVPAAACTAALIWFLIGYTTGSGFFAGLAASACILTRSNLALVAFAGGVWLVADAVTNRTGRGNGWKRLVLFLAGLAPGVLFMGWLNARLFGSPFASGYGSASALLSTARIGTNLRHYTTWISETSPIVWVGLVAIVAGILGPRLDKHARSAFVLFGLTTITVVGLYLLWEPYPEWWYLRFLLPAWPVILVAVAEPLDVLRTRGRLAAVSVLAIVIVVSIAGIRVAAARSAFSVGVTERRYASVAQLVANATEPDAVIITWNHAGAVRYYTGRETIRFDLLDPAWLDRAIDWLRTQGRHPYILIEDWEQSIFDTRFRSGNTLGSLPFPPAWAWQSEHVPGFVYIYDPLRRDAITQIPAPNFERALPRAMRPLADFASMRR